MSQTLKRRWRGGEGRHHGALPIPVPEADLTHRDYTALSLQAQANPRTLCTASTSHCSLIIRVEASCNPVASTGLEPEVCVLRGRFVGAV